MQKINDWDNVQAAGEFEPLELGGHVCRIVRAESTRTKTGREALVLYFDIAEGKQAGYFRKLYDGNTYADKEWPKGGQYLQITEGRSVPYFKGLLTSIEKSNSGYKWDWDESKLKGKVFGGIFGREQYYKNGVLKYATKCFFIRGTDGIYDAPIPADKPPKDDISNQSNYRPDDSFNDRFSDFSDDDCPFK